MLAPPVVRIEPRLIKSLLVLLPELCLELCVDIEHVQHVPVLRGVLHPAHRALLAGILQKKLIQAEDAAVVAALGQLHGFEHELKADGAVLEVIDTVLLSLPQILVNLISAQRELSAVTQAEPLLPPINLTIGLVPANTPERPQLNLLLQYLRPLLLIKQSDFVLYSVHGRIKATLLLLGSIEPAA